MDYARPSQLPTPPIDGETASSSREVESLPGRNPPGNPNISNTCESVKGVATLVGVDTDCGERDESEPIPLAVVVLAVLRATGCHGIASEQELRTALWQVLEGHAEPARAHEADARILPVAARRGRGRPRIPIESDDFDAREK